MLQNLTKMKSFVIVWAILVKILRCFLADNPGNLCYILRFFLFSFFDDTDFQFCLAECCRVSHLYAYSTFFISAVHVNKQETLIDIIDIYGICFELSQSNWGNPETPLNDERINNVTCSNGCISFYWQTDTSGLPWFLTCLVNLTKRAQSRS